MLVPLKSHAVLPRPPSSRRQQRGRHAYHASPYHYNDPFLFDLITVSPCPMDAYPSCRDHHACMLCAGHWSKVNAARHDLCYDRRTRRSNIESHVLPSSSKARRGAALSSALNGSALWLLVVLQHEDLGGLRRIFHPQIDGSSDR